MIRVCSTLFLIISLVGCEKQLRNVDYFLIGDLDTRSDISSIRENLVDVRETVDQLNPLQTVIWAKDSNGSDVTIITNNGKAVELNIKFPFEISSKTSSSLSAIEAKYEFDKLRRDSVDECKSTACVIAEYQCNYKIRVDNKCSIYLISSNLSGRWITTIRWAEMTYWQMRSDEYLKIIGEKLPG